MTASQSPTVRVPELDGIRGTAIVMVLIWHLFILGAAWTPAPGTFFSRSLVPLRLTWTGVDLFFVLSGFLIGGILLDAKESTNYFRVFYARRFFRIVPLYAAILLIFPALLFTAQALRPGNYLWLSENPLPWYSFWSFMQNFWMARANTLGANIRAITWSLAIEEQFYLTLPLIVRFCSGRRFLILVLLGISLAPVFRTLILLNSPTSWVAAFVLMPCRADALLFGVLAAILIRNDKVRERFRNGGWYFGFLFVVLLSGIAFLNLKSYSLSSPIMQMVGYTWMALFYATTLVFVLTHRNGFLSALLRNRALRWLGKLAYGTYLIHQTVQGLIFALIWGQPPGITSIRTLAASVGSLFITLLMAYLSWKFFELPLIRIGHRLDYHT